ncbi:lethal(3)malignant brain tumor-like protein 3 isoform X1 [Macrobrachium nipponense]|uniref:lethal(3)malignant brain tumor-like protein 3 isoform X1 n=2 Tax=Macrobrachium nipponense TaxID=159736 RepID=UPI0030C7CE80
MTDKSEGKTKETQKFVYLQLQQERLGDGRVTALVPGRGSAAPAHFIPLTAKLSVVGSGARPARAAVPVPSPRQQGQGSPIVSVAAPRPTVSSSVSVASTRSLLTTTVTVSGSRPVIASPVPTIAPKPPKGTCSIRRTTSSVVVSSGMNKPGGATIVLGSGNSQATAVYRPALSGSQGAQPHGPVILHTSKVSAPVSVASGTNKMSPRLLPMPLSQSNKQSTTTGTNNNALNMLSVNLGQNKPNMINFKISNGQIQADNLQQVDVLREARPLAQSNKSTDDWKENPIITPSNTLTHTINAGTLTVTAPLCSPVTLPKCTEPEVSILKQPVLASVIEDSEEASSSETVPRAVFRASEDKNFNNIQTVDLQEKVDASRLNKFDTLNAEEVKSSESKQANFGSTFQGVTTLHQSVVSVHPTSNRYQLTSTAPHCVTTVHQQPLVSTHQTFTTAHHSVTSTLPQPQPNIHHQPMALYQSIEAGSVDADEKLRDKQLQPKANDESKIYEEVRKEVLGNLLAKPQNQFRCQSPVSLDNNNEESSIKDLKDDKPHTDQVKIEDERKDVVKIKDELIEEKPNSIITAPEFQVDCNDIKPEQIKFSDLLKWENGVGKLDGSGLKFRMNEFNAVEIVEDRELEEIKNHQNKKFDSTTSRHHARKPNFRDLVKDEEIFSDNSQDSEPQGNKSTRESDDICCCKNCGCYGLSSEFFRDSSFCSLACGEEHDARELEWDKERLKQEKERQKRKRLKQEKLGDQDMVAEGTSDLEESNLPSDEDSVSSKTTAVGSDISVSKYQCPWQDGKNNFSWTKYLEYCGRSKGLAKAAPLKLWPEPFPFTRNLFRPGMKLEAIDPAHQALFCVMTVSETVGFRLRLHFDGYSDQHDYWVNADSPNLFPAGWCEKNGRQLEPPLGVIGFNWKAYLEHCKAQAAPRHAFVNKGHTTMIPPNNFRVGMKLEAEDRKNMWVCVATVADVLDNRVLIHFDGWDKAYDVWNEMSSPYIHPIGWCVANNRVLHPPNDYPNPESFNWHEYLQETNAMAVPARAFKTRPRREFKVNMKVEAVDKRNPSLIRVATIIDIQDYQAKIHFDGWGDEYDYWVDDDSSDLHPPSWCNKTGYRLQVPLTPEQQAEFVESGISCGTPGCKGIGHVKGPIYTTHHTAFGCPYSLQNLNKDPDSVIPDRLHISSERKKGKMTPKIRLDLRPGLPKKEGPSEVEEAEGQKKRVRKRRKFFDELSPPEPNRAHKVQKLSIEETKPHVVTSLMQSPAVTTDIPMMSGTPSTPSTSSNQPVTNPVQPLTPLQPPDEPPEQGVDMIVHQSVFNPGYNPHPVAPVPHSWERHRHLTAPLGDAKRSDVEAWNAEQVQQMVARIPGCEKVSTVFMSEQIDGEALLMMTQSDLVSLLHIKLGPAIKIMAVIMCLRSSV